MSLFDAQHRLNVLRTNLEGRIGSLVTEAANPTNISIRSLIQTDLKYARAQLALVLMIIEDLKD